MEKILGEKKASATINFLVTNGWLDFTPHYHNPENPQYSHTRGFRIPLGYLKLDLFDIGNKLYKKVVVYDKKAINAEKHYRREKRKRFVQNVGNSVLESLINSFDDVYLALHTQEARKLISDYGLNIEKNNYSYLKYLSQVNSRDIEWYHQDKYGRLHYPWLTLRKLCHPLLRFKGFEAYECREVDIKNCQPFLSSIIDEGVIYQLLPEASDLVADINFSTTDWFNYKEMCQQGTIYERWTKHLELSLGAIWKVKLDEYEAGKANKKKKLFNFTKASDRDAAKKAFLYVIFGTQASNDFVSDLFKSFLPDVWAGFNIIKSRYCQHNPSIKNFEGKGSYTNLMWILQRIESEIIINTCVKNLLDMGVTQIIPRHDSILAPEPLLEKVRNELVKAFEEWQLPVPTIH
ncbi:hypothetical protein [Rufibacter ruber]|uniref:hypothetical protein n=1 Tax=Rufibacter ruber TaxID=1783499 RepID=UPI0012903E80|nr:hypothetical protein [Rufibacter ruber]